MTNSHFQKYYHSRIPHFPSYFSTTTYPDVYLPTKNIVFFESDIPSGSHAPMLDRKGRPVPGAGAAILEGAEAMFF